MEYQTFKEELCRILQKRTEGKKKVILQQVEKNNGVVLDAVVLQGEKEQVLPTIYLEELYEIYEEGATLEQIARAYSVRRGKMEGESGVLIGRV